MIMVAAMCFSLVIVGCSRSMKEVPGEKHESQEQEEREEYEEREENTTGSVPKSLEAIESNSEDIIDDVAKKDWTKADERVSSLEKEWSVYEPIAKEKKASQKQINDFRDDLNNLKQLVETKKQYEASLAANRLTLDTISLMDLYKPKVPTAVGKLDYYGRQVMITAEHGDWSQAKKDSESAITTWDTIKKQVENISTAHAKSFSSTLNSMYEAVKKKDLKTTKEQSKKLLDEVDVLESDYKK
ncbi:hypothetical protein [Brassicibacter mesophilus]|uniref:hypothetical protein n=1 Tax=Brassicibacter mesophilus TaxID=745119 RepID=UPI003D1A15B7